MLADHERLGPAGASEEAAAGAAIARRRARDGEDLAIGVRSEASGTPRGLALCPRCRLARQQPASCRAAAGARRTRRRDSRPALRTTPSRLSGLRPGGAAAASRPRSQASRIARRDRRAWKVRGVMPIPCADSCPAGVSASLRAPWRPRHSPAGAGDRPERRVRSDRRRAVLPGPWGRHRSPHPQRGR